MTEIVTAVFAFAALIIVVACTFLGFKPRRPEPELDEDIEHPSVAVIDEALRHVGDNPGAVDWLLDRRLAAKERATHGS